MEKEIAHHVAYEVFRATIKINNLIPLLKDHCDDEEYSVFSKKIGRISGEMGIEILREIFSEYPDIKEEIDNKIKKYNTLLL